MEPDVYVLVNSQGICENKFLWDGVTEWTPPNDTLICKEAEVGISLKIGDLVKQDLPTEEVIVDNILESNDNLSSNLTE
jgi:hypothetical protein